MNTHIVAKHPDIDETLRRYVQRRLRSAIMRLSNQIKNITVKLDRLKNPENGQQRNCVIEIRIDGQDTVVVDGAGPHWLSAIDTAIETAARAVRRKLKTTLGNVAHLQLLKGQHAS